MTEDGVVVADGSGGSGGEAPVEIDTSVPHSARIYNYWLGGRDNYAVDREAGDAYVAAFPGIIDAARASRVFLTRAVRFLAGEAGIRQFLDIGTGLPTVDNTHEVAQRVAPDAHVVYVDNDPLVLTHARALLTSTPEGATHYIDADVREPERVLAQVGERLDFGRPVALMLMGIMGHVSDDDEALSIAGRLLAPLPSGSYLALYDGTRDFSPAFEEAQQGYDDTGAIPYKLRPGAQIRRFFDGLELVEPGFVMCSRWRPEAAAFGEPADVDVLCAVGRKP
ncbi:SAM-dependent methyltransferase [Streptomyces sp. 6N223]|uniref:SAM-dependent methyltransferase n=1 Tax=Streptomyces sp. 6N223 TaxID=3457412 RepID=UPI003FD13162